MFENIDIDLTAKAAGAWIALGGFLFGVYQYAKAQRWRKAEFAAKELEKLNSDQVLGLACIFLDWSSRSLNTPDNYKEKAGTSTFIHTWQIMEKAMVGDLAPTDGRDGFDWQEVLYRDVFDRYFTYLDMINHYLNIGLIEKKDVATLKYWLEQINKSQLANGKSIFEDYMNYFGYEGVLELLSKFRIRK